MPYAKAHDTLSAFLKMAGTCHLFPSSLLRTSSMGSTVTWLAQ